MNRGEEDYLKAIYQLLEEKQMAENTYIQNTEIANFLEHTLQTVNETVKKLAKKNWVIYKPYRGCQLTEKGKKNALRLIRVHRMWELFLREKLGYSWEEVHQEAEQLEHATSELLEKRLYDYLGRPTTCPHGSPIPDLLGNIKGAKLLPLSESAINKTYELKQVLDNHQLLLYLNKKGIHLKSVFKVVEKDEVSQLMTLKIQGKVESIGFNVAKLLYVKLKEESSL